MSTPPPDEPDRPAQPGPVAPGQPTPGEPAPRKPPGIGIGVLSGCGAHVLATIAAFALLYTGTLGFFLPFIIVGVAGIVLLCIPRTRRFGTGVLIVAASVWIVWLGPCVALMGGFG